MTLHPGIQPMMLLSTAHLTLPTQERLNQWCRSIDLTHRMTTTSAPFFMGPTDFGWLVYCTTETEHDAVIPADLRECMDYALRHGCYYLLFDSETVDARDDLPVHEGGIL